MGFMATLCFKRLQPMENLWSNILKQMSIGPCLALLCLTFFCGATAQIHPEARLLDDLMSTYRKDVRPMSDPNAKMPILVIFSLKKIESLDEQAQILTSFGWLVLKWQDEFLKWNPLDYSGTNRLVLPADRIWLPEIAMYNSVDQGDDLSLSVQFRVEVTHEGRVKFAPGFKWRTECKVNLMMFPYDKQVCNVTFVNWVYGYPSTVFIDAGIQLINYEDNEEWELTNATTSSGAWAVDEEGAVIIPKVGFTLYVQRRPMYYIANIIIPCFMIALISCVVFLLPSDSGEKISMAITVTLAYTVLLLMVSEITPKSGTSTPHITVFLVVSMGQTTVCLLVTVLILNIYHHNPNKPVPRFLQTVMFGIIGRILCMPMRTLHPGCCIRVKPKDEHKQNRGNGLIHTLNVEELDTSKVSGVMSGIPDDVIAYARYMKMKGFEQEIEDHNKDQWMALGKVTDRLFFVLFLIATILEVATFMGTVATGGSG